MLSAEELADLMGITTQDVEAQFSVFGDDDDRSVERSEVLTFLERSEF